MDRRAFLKTGGLAIAGASVANTLSAAEPSQSFTLRTAPSKTHIVGPDFQATDVWSFNGQVPGSPIRLTVGQQLDVDVVNQLSEPTAVHWHGIRLPNAMDGVAGLTQKAILPTESFHYSFTPPDAGTFWYHSHMNAYEQVGRGLYGPLIIEETKPPVVDRDLIWMIDDWRLLEDASISNDFGAGHDMSHAGRIGNVPTINGRFRDVVKVRSGERIRLRLINAANARVFSLNFESLNPTIIAIDGQPVVPHQPNGPIVIGAAGRVDIIIDMTGKPNTKSAVQDSTYRESFDLTHFVYEEKLLRENILQSPIELPAANLPEPDLLKAVSQEVVIAGGAMGGLRKAMLNGEWLGLREIAQQGYVWAINDVVGNKLDMPPLIDVPRGTSVRLIIKNETAFPHPMHLHGHHMKVLKIDGKDISETLWVDSPLLMPKQKMEFAFVADNPGDWLFHCHALEHHAAGLGSLVRIS
ncbi:multicopper oxidase family protein [Granulosicoccus sp.]|nr:multicopper oxidase family protein [Granulosicoccus sp.]MDB4223830.1 multicopper oxidase family protein [Granulosicoccus sp.]